jgi:deoxyribodipyrimidine photo-lyase
MTQKAVFWFTDDLRLNDNIPLHHLCQRDCEVSFIYVVNPADFLPHNYQHKAMGDHRFQFIHQSLSDLNEQLAQLNSSLTILHGDPVAEVFQFVRNNHIGTLARSTPVGLYEQRTWQHIQALLNDNLPDNAQPVECLSAWNHTLFDAGQLDIDINSKTMQSFSRFRKYVEGNDIAIHAPYPSRDALSTCKLDTQSTTTANNVASLLELASRYFANDLANDLAKSPIVNGGEQSASNHLHDYFSSAAASTYKQTRNHLDGWQNSTKFSPFLATGTLSPRQIWHRLKEYENQNGANDSTYWIGFELLWREYFQWAAIEQQEQLFAFKGLAKQKPKTSFYPERFKKWCEGTTPYPLVNACMKELAETGFMSNRGRQIVASCLVHELAIDWRFGAAYFQQQLIDYDVASNWGNWQYIAGVGKDPRGGRQFNIDKQTALHDAKGEFIGKWQGRDQAALPLDSVDYVDWPVEVKS